MSKIPRGQTAKRRAYMAAYRIAHPRDRSAYLAAYRLANRDKASAYRAANKERIAARKAADYAANCDKIKARVKARADANKDLISDYQAAYYEANAAKVKTRVAAYQSANPQKKAHWGNSRRARKIGNGGSHTFQQRIEKFELLGNVCFYCGCDKKLTPDHKTPLARGGTDDIRNIVPACSSCNTRKNARTAREYLACLRRRTNHQRGGGVDSSTERTR